MGTITFKLGGEAAKAVSEYQKIIDKQDQAIQKLRQMGQVSDRSTSTMSGGIKEAAISTGKFALQIAGVGSAIGGVMAVAAQLRREYDDLVRKQREAAAEQMTAGQLRGAALLNLPASMQAGEVDRIINEISSRRNVEQKALWGGAGAMLSGKGALSSGQFAGALDVAARLRAYAGEAVDVGVIGGGLQDIMRVTQIKSGMQTFGWARQFGTEARIVNPLEQVLSLAPAISAAAGAGATPEQVAELLAGMTQTTADITGERSSTAVINFLGALTGKKIFPSEVVRGGKRTMEWGLVPGETFGERMGALRSRWATMSREERAEMEARIGGRAKSRAYLRDVISQSGAGWTNYQAAVAGIRAPEAEGTIAFAEEYFRNVEAGEFEPIRRTGRAFDVAIEKMKLTDPGALAGVLREKMGALLAARPDISELERREIMAGFEFRSRFGFGDVLGAAEAALERIPGGGRYKEHTWIGPHGTEVTRFRSDIPEGYEPAEPWKGRRRWTRGRASVIESERYEPGMAQAIESLRDELGIIRETLQKRGTEDEPTEVIVKEDRRRSVITPDPDRQRE